jgi:hypothetical protein
MNCAIMRWTAAAVLVLASHGAVAAGYPGILITPPGEGEYVYWVAKAPQPAEGETPTPPGFLMRGVANPDEYPDCLIWPTAFSGDSLKVELKGIEPPSAEEGKQVAHPSVIVGLYALGLNLAGQKTVTLDPEAAVEVMFTEGELDHVGRLSVDVGTVKTGTVILESGSWRTAVTVLPSDKGKVGLFFVPTGSVTATLRYDGAESEPLKFTVRIPEKGEVQTAKLIPTGYERKETAKPKREAAGSEKEAERGKREPSAASGARMMLLSIIVLAAIVVAGYWYARSRKLTLGGALGKLGITDIPQPQPTSPGGAADTKPLVPEGVCEFCGQQRDAAGRCACTVVGGAAVPAGPLAAVAGAKLIGTLGEAANQVCALADVTTIGREPDNTIALTQDTTASRRHAEIRKHPDGYVISDLGSSNGTFVNGNRITQHTLRPGDEVRIGSCGFRFEVS